MPGANGPGPKGDCKMLNSSIVTYLDRGPYGNNKYRGNCTGYLVKQLIEFFQSTKVFDPMCGSGTTGDVCLELGTDFLQLDLNPKFGGFDALNDEIPESSDMIFFHPPYHNIINYSGIYYPEDKRDLSRCPTYEDFIHKIDMIQEKLLYSLKRGGRLVILVGDIKKQGKLYSIQKDLKWFGSPEYCLIKRQVNTWSSRVNYTGSRFIPLEHEYILIFKKDDCYVVPQKVLVQTSLDIRKNQNATWKDLIYSTLQKLGGKAELEIIYSEMKDFKKCEANHFWKEKIRQVLQIHKDFVRINKGEYAIA